MKLKLCVLGNSHTGALKRAWDKLIEGDFKKNFDVTFFASRASGLSGLCLKEKFLIPTNQKLKENLEFTSNGLSFIDIEKYDLFLVYGLDINPYYTSHDFFSANVLNQSIKDNYKHSLGYKILKMISEKTSKKIYLGHTPLTVNIKNEKIKSNKYINNQYISGINLVNKIFFEKRNSKLISQPCSTRTDHDRNTRLEFSKGSIRLDVGDMLDGQTHSIKDYKHMNDEFGKIWFESFLDTIKLSRFS